MKAIFLFSLAVVAVVLGSVDISAQALPAATRPTLTRSDAFKGMAPAVFLSATALDWTSTYAALQTQRMHEDNAELRWLSGHPAAVVALGATQDVLGLWLLTRLVGPKHPQLAKAGLYVAAGLRVAIAARNIERYRNVALGR